MCCRIRRRWRPQLYAAAAPGKCSTSATTTRRTIKSQDVSSRRNTRSLQVELRSTTCSESGAVHTVSRVTRLWVRPRCRLTPRRLGSAGQFSPLPWRRLRFPGCNNASLSSQRSGERSRLSAEAVPVADRDWPLENLSGKRAQPQGVTYRMQSISAWKCLLALVVKKSEPKASSTCMWDARLHRPASDPPTCLARQEPHTFHAVLNKRCARKQANRLQRRRNKDLCPRHFKLKER